MSEFTLTGTYVPVACGYCDIVFGMPEDFYRRRKEDHKTWHCPNGHPRYFKGKSEVERVREELEAAQRSLERTRRWAEQEARRAVSAEMSRRVTKGHLTRIKRRVAAGVCPSCKRSFQNLHRHMAGQHPDFGPSA